MTTRTLIYYDDESDEEVEVEFEITGGFHRETWGYSGGTPAEEPYVDILSSLPGHIDEDHVVEMIMESLRSERGDEEDREYYRLERWEDED